MISYKQSNLWLIITLITNIIMIRIIIIIILYLYYYYFIIIIIIMRMIYISNNRNVSNDKNICRIVKAFFFFYSARSY